MSDKNDHEKYLRGEPLNEHMAALLEENVEPEDRPETPQPGELTEDDREHLRRLLTEPGWRVLLKLLDTDIASLEDSARRSSLSSPFGNLNAKWAEVSYAQKARDRIVILATIEIEKLKAKNKNGALLGRQGRERQKAD